MTMTLEWVVRSRSAAMMMALFLSLLSKPDKVREMAGSGLAVIIMLWHWAQVMRN